MPIDQDNDGLPLESQSLPPYTPEWLLTWVAPKIIIGYTTLHRCWTWKVFTSSHPLDREENGKGARSPKRRHVSSPNTSKSRIDQHQTRDMTTVASLLDTSPTVEEVDRRIASLEDERVHKLRHYRNQHSTISRLPPEILTTIFTFVALSEGTPRKSLKEANLRHGRLIITHVCQHWRNTAITNPRIWCIVYTNMPRELARLFVERSRSRSLYVATDLNTSRHSEDTIDYLLTHSTRIWRFEIRNCPLDIVKRLARLNLPMLEQVSLAVDDDRHQPARMTFLHGPPLRYLSLRNVLFDLDSPFLSQIRTLKLNYTDPFTSEEYPRKLLPLLSRLQHLRHLELDVAIVALAKNLEDTIVEMPSLLTLQLRAAKPPTLQVLDHLHQENPPQGIDRE